MTPSRGIVTVSVDVAAPADVVFDEMVAWDRQGEWMLGTDVRCALGDGRGVGGRIDAWTGVGRVGFLDSMVITRWDEADRVVVVDHVGRVVRGEGVMRVTEIAHDRSRVWWGERVEVPGGALGMLAWGAVRPVTTAAVTMSLRRFARNVEVLHGARGDRAGGPGRDRE